MAEETQSKKWWQSKTIWGLAITAVSIAAPKYKPIADVLPSVAENFGEALGLILAGYGRLKAEKQITK